MKIHHIAIWCQDLERMRFFYETYFGAVSNEKYINEKKQFQSYFLKFEGEVSLELMQKVNIPANINDVYEQFMGLNHFAISVGSEQAVNEMTEKLRNDGFGIIGEARWTGDGYYESVVFDPEKNRIEITI